MGLMESPATGVITPHPITLDGQVVGLQLRQGETLAEFVSRAVPDGFDDGWEVRVNGHIVPHEVMARVRPKAGAVVEVRGLVKRNALYIVAFAVLTYFTMGAGATWAAGWGLGAAATTAVYAAAFVAGSILINKVLGPKPPEARTEERETVHNIGASRNRPRPYEPLPLVFGTVRYAPDVVSMPYTWYQGEDQYLGMVLTPGINAHSVEALYNGDTPLADFEGVSVYHRGFPGMTDQNIPLFSDADTIAGGELDKDGTWVTRTTPDGTIRIQINLEYILGDVTSKGKPYNNTETVVAEYRPAGGSTWSPLVSRDFVNDDYNPKRATLTAVVPSGQYDVRVRRLGNAFEEKNGRAQFQWVTMTAVQADQATYAGIPRIGVMMKATGQLNGAPDELRCVVHSRPIPVWKGATWETEETSNPGAQILAYARGIEDENGDRIAGIGLPEEMIDLPALQAFMLHCAANGYGYNYVVKEVRNHEEMLNSLALAGFGQITWAGGRLSVVWADSEQPVSGVVNMATIKKGAFQVDYTLANAADGVELTYYDSTDWTTKTLRVPAPGVPVMLNPASITAEGVTDEEHAAKLARWHLAQSLYQYKDISYSTDIEHLSYRRMSLLSLQHDLTQWGFGGRLVAASEDGGLTLKLDEPVPPLATRYVGIRVPGERVYRVFQVQAFSEPTDELHLVGTWPADAAFPGDAPDNPAHDYLWCYDFKATPGLRARVVAIEPESDLKGARVAVVPESQEFWTYVETGVYIPPAPVSSLRTRPIASDLEITERRVVQGDTVFTELVATFAIDGPLSHSVVLMSDANGELHEVAQTATRTASWRVDEPGVYTIVVRPFSPEGRAGIAVQTVYATEGVAMPPVLVDLFDVVDRSGGVRQYTWGWLSETTQSPDFAGVEIRYIAGTDPDPDWEAMTPVGEDGFFTAPFEHTLPEDGTWTFACRSRNTAGDLSTGMRVITRTIGANLGQIIGGIDQELIDKQAAIDQEIADRIAEDLRIAGEAAADATAKANAALATAMAAVNALEAQVADIVGAPDWDPLETYEPGQMVKFDGGLYRALVQTTGDQPDTSPAQWEKVGDYDSLGEAVAAALTLATQTASELEAEVTRINALYARMPAGTDGLATEAMVLAEAQALANDISAEATRIDGLAARMPASPGVLATEASVSDEASARADADSALGQRIDVTQASIGQSVLLSNPDFELGATGWQEHAYSLDSDLPLPANVDIYAGSIVALIHTGTRAMRVSPPASAVATNVYNSNRFAAGANDRVSGSIEMRSHFSSPPPAGTTVVWGVRWFGPDMTHNQDTVLASHVFSGTDNYFYGTPLRGEVTAPSGTAYGRYFIRVSSEFHGAPGPLYFDAAMASRGGAVATASDLSLVQTEVSQQGDTLTAHAQRLDAQQTEIEGKASTDYVEQVEGIATAAQGQASANLTAITGLTATVGNHTSSISELREVSVSAAGGNAIVNASFENAGTGRGWGDGTGSLPGGGFYFATTAARSGSNVFRFNAAATLNNAGLMAVPASRQIRVGFWSRHVGGAAPDSYIRFTVRGYDAQMNQVLFSAVGGSATRAGGGTYDTTWRKNERIYTVPSDVVFIRGVLQTTTGDWTGNWMVDDVFMEPVSELDAKTMARHTIALNVNGHVSGTVSENDGETSSFSIMADSFSIVPSSSSGERLHWSNGNLRIYDSSNVLRVRLGVWS